MEIGNPPVGRGFWGAGINKKGSFKILKLPFLNTYEKYLLAFIENVIRFQERFIVFRYSGRERQDIPHA